MAKPIFSVPEKPAEEPVESNAVAEQPICYEQLSRRDRRSLVFHFLYSLEMLEYEESVHAVIDNYNRWLSLDVPLEGELIEMLQTLVAYRDDYDAIYIPFLERWSLDRISIPSKLILRYGIWELLNTTTDPRIIINEAIELAKCFGEVDSYRFINGVLDRYLKSREKADSSEET